MDYKELANMRAKINKEIIRLRKSGATYRVIQEELGCSTSQAFRVVRRSGGS